MPFGINQQVIVIDFDDEGNPVRILSGHHAENPQCGRHAAAAAFHGKFHDVSRIEIDGIRRKRRRGAVFNSLIHWQNRQEPVPASRP